MMNILKSMKFSYTFLEDSDFFTFQDNVNNELKKINKYTYIDFGSKKLII